MTLRATEQSSRTRAKACMDVIKNGLKEEHLNPKAMVNGLEDGSLKLVAPRLITARYCMDVLRDGLKEHHLKPSDLANDYDVSNTEFKAWLSDCTLPFDVFLDICKKQHVKVDDLFHEASNRIKADQSNETLQDAPEVSIPDVTTIKEWFEGDMPFIWFMEISAHAKIKAPNVFAKAKELMKRQREESTGSNSGTVEPPFDKTYIKEVNDQGPKVGVDPWTPEVEAKFPPADEPADQPDDLATTHGKTGAATPSESVSVDHGDVDGALEAWDDSSSVKTHMVPIERSHSPKKQDSSGGVRSTSNGATGSAGDGEAGVKVEREVAPGVTEVDMSTPIAVPYKIKLTGKDSGMKDVDVVMLNWPTLKKKALDLRDDLTEESRREIEENYPAPVKVSNEIVGLKFNDADGYDSFVADGYMRELQDVIDREGLVITLQQSNFKPLERGV